jgi:hypothetical protein
MNYWRLLCGASLFVGGVLAVLPAGATTWRVPADAVTIQAGMDLAAAGDTVEVACGTYHDCTHPTPVIVYDAITACVIMKSGVTLISETGQPDCVVIDAQQQGIGIYAGSVDATTRIIGITITGAGVPTTSQPVGAGIEGYDASLQISNCRFVDNGTGVNCVVGAPSFSACEFTGQQWSGGRFGYAQPTFADCVFTDNEAIVCADFQCEGAGGGLFLSSCAATLMNCSFRENRSHCGGGGIYSFNSSVDLTSCLLTGNVVRNWPECDSSGGGISCVSSQLVLTDCSLVQNEAYACGGGICLKNASNLQGFNTDVLENTAVWGSGGYVAECCQADFVCCDVRLGHWRGGGPVTLDNEDCSVATETRTWGGVKALYR